MRSSTVHFHQRLLFPFPYSFLSLNNLFLFIKFKPLKHSSSHIFRPNFLEDRKFNQIFHRVGSSGSSSHLPSGVRIPVWLPRKTGKITGFFLINQTGGTSFLVFVVRFFFWIWIVSCLDLFELSVLVPFAHGLQICYSVNVL